MVLYIYSTYKTLSANRNYGNISSLKHLNVLKTVFFGISVEFYPQNLFFRNFHFIKNFYFKILGLKKFILVLGSYFHKTVLSTLQNFKTNIRENNLKNQYFSLITQQKFIFYGKIYFFLLVFMFNNKINKKVLKIQFNEYKKNIKFYKLIIIPF